MAGIAASSIGELTTTTLRNLERLNWSMIHNTLQEYHAWNRFTRRGAVEREDGGYGIQWNVQVSSAGTFDRSLPYDTDEVRTAETMATATAPWVHAKWHWALDTRVISMNKGPAKLVDMWQAQRVAALVNAAKELETDWWSAPDASNATKPRALRYYVVKNASTGFTGAIPSGFSDVAGISPTTYTQWKNWSDIYTTVSIEDFVRRAARAMRNCHFMPPVSYSSSIPEMPRWQTYTNDTVLQILPELAAAQNQNIGPDLAFYEGKASIGRITPQWVPFIDTDTADPFYGIDWSSFKPVVLNGEYLRETGPDATATSHNMKVMWVDLTYTFKCHDRRRNFVLATTAS